MPFIYDPTAGGSTPTTEEWVRPSDWLTLPTLGSSEQKFVGLYAVYESGSNFISLSAAGNYTVNWGDGVIENYNTGVQSYHTYNYSAISSETLSDRGYRQVIVTVTPQAGQNLTNINLQRKHNQAGLQSYVSPWLDISLNAPNLTSVSIGGTIVLLGLLERATIGQIGAVTDFTSMFQNCFSLQSVPLFNTASGTNFSTMFRACYSLQTVPLFNTASGTNFLTMFFDCYSLQTVPLFNTASGTSFQSMFRNCYSLQTVPLFNTASGTSFSNMFYNCYSLQTVPLFNTASGTNFSNMFFYCYSLQSVPLFNTASGTDFTSMFQNCSSLQSVPLFNTASGTNFSTMFRDCYSLQSVPLFNTALGTNFSTMFFACSSLSQGALSGTRYAISYSGCKLSREEIVSIFNNLGTAAGAQTITITGNWGTSSLTAGDLAIATGKGWTVAT
jgi:hypothetical protein